jgi:hypothetical protein
MPHRSNQAGQSQIARYLPDEYHATSSSFTLQPARAASVISI